MKIYIWKYGSPNASGFLNYFMSSPAPQLVDKIKINNLMLDGFPVYSETLEVQDQILEFQAPEFDLKFSLLQTDLSVNGSSIKDFLLPASSTPVMFICVVDFGAKQIIGKIQLDSIECDTSSTQNKYDVSFHAIGIGKEYSDYLNRFFLQPVDPYPGWECATFLIECLLKIPALYFNTVSMLDLTSKVGWLVVLAKNLYNQIVGNGSTTGILKPCWDGFKEIARGLGFLWRFDVGFPGNNFGNIFNNTYPPVTMTLFWRSQGVNQVSIQTTSFVLRNSKLNVYKNYLMLLYRNSVNADPSRYNGLLMDNLNNIWVADEDLRFGIEEVIIGKNNIYTTSIHGQTPPMIVSSDATMIELPAYLSPCNIITNSSDVNFSFGANISLASLFCQRENPINVFNHTYIELDGVAQVFQKTIGVEYQYLIAGMKKEIETGIVLDENTALAIGDSTLFGSSPGNNILNTAYRCSTIRQIDWRKKEEVVVWEQC